MKKPIYTLFITSTIAPTKLARYRLLSIGTVMHYLFLFITCITCSAFFHFLFGATSDNTTLHVVQQYMHDAGLSWMLYPFAFLFLFTANTLLIMVHISIVTAVVQLFMMYYPVRIQFRQLWRITAFALTFHYIAYMLAPFLPLTNFIYSIAFCITLCYTFLAAMHFPSTRRFIAK